MYLWIVVVLQQLLQNILGQLQKLIDVLEQRPMIVRRNQIFPLSQLRHEALDTEIHSTDKVLLSIYQLYEISLPQTVGILLG